MYCSNLFATDLDILSRLFVLLVYIMDSFIEPYDILFEVDLSVIHGNLVFLLYLFCYFTLKIVLSSALTFF